MQQHEQLLAERRARRAFALFNEQDLNFAPTYRLERHSEQYCRQTKVY